MTGFWDSELGNVTGNVEDAFAKDKFERVPDGTLALAKIESFVNAEHNGNKYLTIEWLLTDGEYKGSKVNQKIKAFDSEPKVKHRSLNMLKLIYKLYNITPKHANPPSDQELASFLGKQAGIKVRETEPNDQGKQYNWVSEIHPAAGFKCETGKKIEITHTRSSVDSAFSRFDSNKEQTGDVLDDLPF